MDLRPELINWTRDALERLFDPAFLRHHVRAACVAGRFNDGNALQEMCLGVIRQFQPPLNVSAASSAWRTYNVLSLRYVQGLSQSETATQLGIGTRQMRREQQHAIRAVTMMLFADDADAGEQDETSELSAQAAHSENPPLSQETLEPVQRFCHLDDLLRSTLRLFDTMLEQQQLRVIVAIPPSMPPIKADQIVLRQMLVSGISWAVRDVAGATVTIEAVIERGKVILTMSKPYDQAHTSSGAAHNELATAKQLADLIGAEIVQIIDPSIARLQYHLPTNDAKCILMIDDHQHASQLVRRYLQQSDDFYLVSVSTPQNALRHVVEVRPACILLDVMMPEHDGWELLTLFRAHPEISAIPIIVSSVLKVHDLAYSLGATAVLTKPFNATQLIELLKSVTQDSSLHSGVLSHRSQAT